MKKKNYLFAIIIILILTSMSCNIGVTINPDYTSTESALKATQNALDIELSPAVDDIVTTSENIEDTNNLKPTATITPEWLIPQTSIYITQIEMPTRAEQKPNANVEFKIHFGNWSNVSIPPFDIKCLLLETGEEVIIENIELEPTKYGIANCSLSLPDHSGSFTIQAYLDINHEIENRDDVEITMTNSGYIE